MTKDAIQFVAKNTKTFSDRAACKGSTNLWFSELLADRRKAKEICASCPVLNDCYEYAISLPSDTEGIFAGLEQAQLRPVRNKNIVRPINHGTIGGYSHHHRRGESACEECRRAWADYTSNKFKMIRAKYTVNELNQRIKHGTYSGHELHRKYGIPPCEACKQAKAEYQRQFHQQRKK